jgi:hypothetical protein
MNAQQVRPATGRLSDRDRRAPRAPRGRLEQRLAALLRYGTWSACAAIAMGLAWGLLDASARGADASAGSPTRLVTLGVALFILLPVLRVTMMAIAFASERDYLFLGLATLVLAIVGLGLALG